MKRVRTSEHSELEERMSKKQGLSTDFLFDAEENSSLPLSSVQSILQCSICSELMIKAHSLHCSHSFCQHCIHKWLKVSKTCPCCRRQVLRRPIANKVIDQLIECYESVMGQNERASREEYKTMVENAKQISAEELKAKIEKAKNDGLKFLNILEQWKEQEKLLFKVGLDKYDDTERLLYIELTGLTKQLINEASNDQLDIICANLNVNIPYILGRKEPDYKTAKLILLDIINAL
jgi:hypothetical protein